MELEERHVMLYENAVKHVNSLLTLLATSRSENLTGTIERL